jgi:hypothetical protein
VRVYYKSWGCEIVIGARDRVVRIYAKDQAHGGLVTLDMSQVTDMTWDKALKVRAKYTNTKILLSGEKLRDVIVYFGGDVAEIVGLAAF